MKKNRIILAFGLVFALAPAGMGLTSKAHAELIAPMNYPHAVGSVAVVDDVLYVWAGMDAGGTRHDHVEAYNPTDPVSGWTLLADSGAARIAAGNFALDGELYQVGGEGPWGGHFNKDVYKYNPGESPEQGPWPRLNDFPTNIESPYSVVCCGKAYVMGGRHGYGRTYPHVYEYDKTNDAWVPRDPMPYHVYRGGSVCYGGKVWLFGGAQKLSQQTTEWVRHIQIYDCATDTWELWPDVMPWLLGGDVRAVAYEDCVYMIAEVMEDENTGGWIPNEYVYVYSPECDNWERFPWNPPNRIIPQNRIGLIGSYAYFTRVLENGTTSNLVYRLNLADYDCPRCPGLGLDIKPGSCPNPVNRGSHGVLPVAVVGAVDFDVTMIDVLSVRLSRADGVGGEVAPNEGPPGPHSTVEDVATPFEGEACDCHGAAGDGIDDLSLKFRTDDVVAALLLSTFEPGDEVELVVTGVLLDGSAFTTAGDCIRIVPSRTSAVRAKAGQASGRPGRLGGRQMTAGQRP